MRSISIETTSEVIRLLVVHDGYSQKETFDLLKRLCEDKADVGLDVTIANGKVASISIHN